MNEWCVLIIQFNTEWQWKIGPLVIIYHLTFIFGMQLVCSVQFLLTQSIWWNKWWSTWKWTNEPHKSLFCWSSLSLLGGPYIISIHTWHGTAIVQSIGSFSQIVDSLFFEFIVKRICAMRIDTFKYKQNRTQNEWLVIMTQLKHGKIYSFCEADRTTCRF